MNVVLVLAFVNDRFVESVMRLTEYEVKFYVWQKQSGHCRMYAKDVCR